MTEFELDRLNTIDVTADEVYELVLSEVGYINIHNDTSGIVTIADTSADLDSESSITIGAGGGYSNLSVNGSVYIRSTADGDVQVVARR